MTNLLKPKAAAVTAPTPAPVATMPDAQSPDVLEARRKAQADVARRGGRASTILTAPQDRGGGNYSKQQLG
jgi:hypothetical protein